MKKIAGISLSIALLFGTAACNMPAPTGDDDCYSVSTGREVEDEACEDGEDGYVWGADSGEREEDDDDDHIVIFGSGHSKTHKPTKKPTTKATTRSSTTKSTTTRTSSSSSTKRK